MHPLINRTIHFRMAFLWTRWWCISTMIKIENFFMCTLGIRSVEVAPKICFTTAKASCSTPRGARIRAWAVCCSTSFWTPGRRWICRLCRRNQCQQTSGELLLCLSMYARACISYQIPGALRHFFLCNPSIQTIAP